MSQLQITSYLRPTTVLRIPKPRVENVADAVAKKVKAEDAEEDRRARSDDEPGVDLEIAATLIEHLTPGWSRRLDAEPEK